MAYTPRTDFDGNATYMTNGYRSIGRTNLSALDSVENSFHTPTKDNDVIRGFGPRKRVSDGSKAGTPRANMTSKSSRSAFRNLPAAMGKGEFTPLMKSATKNNFLKNLSMGPKTPGYRENGRGSGTPGLTQNMSDIYEEDITTEQQTPQPQVMSSSAPSSPFPGGLMGRNGGMLGEGNPTLREQEKIIDRLDKDNWNLKLKCHFFEEQLARAGPEVNSIAVKENSELKIAKLTLQRELARYKKGRKQIEEELRLENDGKSQELEKLRSDVEDLREELRLAHNGKSQELEKLRDDVEDLEAELRAKDRAIEERDDELEIARAQSRIEDLQFHMKSNSDQLGEELEKVRSERDLIQQDLDFHKSKHHETSLRLTSTLDDLQRQSDEKELLQNRHQALTDESEGLKIELSRAQSRIEELQLHIKSNSGQLGEELEKVRSERDLIQQDLDFHKSKHHETSLRLTSTLDDLQRQSDEKELLQNRHQALTEESAGLQIELSRAQSRVEELQLHLKSNSGQLGDELEKIRRERDSIQRDHDFLKTEKERISSRLDTALSSLQRQSEESGGLKIELSRAQSRIEELQLHMKSNSGQLGDELEKIRRERDLIQRNRDLLENEKERISSRLNTALDDLQRRSDEEQLQLHMKSKSGQLGDELEKIRRERDLIQRDRDLLEIEKERISSRLSTALDDLQRRSDEEQLQLHMNSKSGQLGDELEKIRRERDLIQRDRDLLKNEKERISSRLSTALDDLQRRSDEDQLQLQMKIKKIRRERDLLLRDRDLHKSEKERISNRLDAALDDLQRQSDEQELLQNRQKNRDNTSTIRHDKEIRGLGKEIVWLRARLQREQKFRRDLAWSKGLMELGERVRVACNSTDLRMINKMGVDAQYHPSTRTPRNKLRSAISLVMATVRMKRMCQDWQRTKKIGEGLKRAKSEMIKRRASRKGALDLSL